MFQFGLTGPASRAAFHDAATLSQQLAWTNCGAVAEAGVSSGVVASLPRNSVVCVVAAVGFVGVPVNYLMFATGIIHLDFLAFPIEHFGCGRYS